MDRRAFLRLLGAAGVGSTLNRKYFFAPHAGWLPGRQWQHFSVTLPKPGIYTAEIDYGCKWELTDFSYLVMAAHPITDIQNIWLNGSELTGQLQIAACGPVQISHPT